MSVDLRELLRGFALDVAAARERLRELEERVVEVRGELEELRAELEGEPPGGVAPGTTAEMNRRVSTKPILSMFPEADDDGNHGAASNDAGSARKPSTG